MIVKKQDTNNKKIVSSELLSEISKRINIHHMLYKTLSIKDKYWEYILTDSYRTIGFTVKYDVENHVSGKDLEVKNLFNDGRDIGVSCKSGKICLNKQNEIATIEISSYRTTKYKTLDEKLNYIDEEHEDVVYSLSSTLFNSHKKYILTVFTPLKFKNFKWETNKSGYYMKSDFFTAKILKQCSDQLWYKINYDSPHILEAYEICIN
jgi:hypothetical protein